MLTQNISINNCKRKRPGEFYPALSGKVTPPLSKRGICTADGSVKILQQLQSNIPMTTDAEVEFNSGMTAFEAREFVRAMHFLLPFAEQGVAEAQHRVAIMQQNGLGMVRNESQAYKWMKAGAEQGHPLAQHGLGFMYMQGDCVAKSSEKAVYWFTQAAEQGLAGSQTTLAMMYENGDGVEQDLDAAKKWYAEAGY